MAEYNYENVRSGFYDSINGDRRYSSEDFGRIYEGMVPYNTTFEEFSGVYTGVGKNFMVTAGSGIVTVSPGRAIVNGTWVCIDAPVTLDVATNNTGKDRTDCVHLEVNRTDSRRAIVRVTTGVTAAQLVNLYKNAAAFVMPIAVLTVKSDNTIDVGRTVFTDYALGIRASERVMLLPDRTDLDTVISPGLYYIRNTSNIVNYPNSETVANIAYLEVIEFPYNEFFRTSVMQRLTIINGSSGATPATYVRSIRIDRRDNSIGMSLWSRYTTTKLTQNIDYYDTLPSGAGHVKGDIIFVKAGS